MNRVNYLRVIYSEQGKCCSDQCIFHWPCPKGQAKFWN